jgi:hypothetical protein
VRKRTFTQWLSSVLAVCLVLSSSSVGAFAAERNAKDWGVRDSGISVSSETLEPTIVDSSAPKADGFQGGTGSEKNPFLISNQESLVWFAQQVNSGTNYEGLFIALSQDIALSGEWTPIGSSNKSFFAGTFDGQGHTVKGMTIGTEQAPSQLANIGLFGYIGSSAAVRNVHMSDVEIRAKSDTTAVMAGALVGATVNGSAGYAAVLDHCTAQGTISFTAGNKKNGNIGGLVGFLNQYAVVSNASADIEMDITQIGEDAFVCAGGLVGFCGSNNVVVNCAATGRISAEKTMAKAYVGGLSGVPAAITYNCYFSGTVSGKETGIGGIGGKLMNHTVLRSAYPQGLKACADETGGVIEKETVIEKTKEEISSDEFTKWMNDGITTQSRSSAKAKNPLLAAMMEKVNGFYEWEVSSQGPQITDRLWVSGEVDTKLFAGGTGTKQNPYQLKTEAQLRAFANSLSDSITYENQYIALQNNISLSSDEWVPAGNGDYVFSGTFDGCGYAVSGLTIGSKQNPKKDEKNATYFGLFGILENALVKDLSLDVSIYVNGQVGIFTAGLAGYSSGSTVDGVKVSGTVYGTSGSSEKGNQWKSNHFSGGLIGRQDKGTVINCGSTASIYAGTRGGIAEAGGLVGLNNQGLIANSYGAGIISGNAIREKVGDREYEGMPALGGIVGVNGGTVAQCYASSNIRADVYSYYVGEIAGWVTGIGKMFTSYYDSEVSQKIVEQAVHPVQHIGWLVSAGKNDEGIPYGGGVDYHNVALKKADMTAASFAEKLNKGFNAFPVNLSSWGNPSLCEWVLKDNAVMPIGKAGSVTFVQPDINDSQKPTTLFDGTFLGRSADENLIVSIQIKKSKITAAAAAENSKGYSLEALLPLVIQANGTSALTGTDEASAALKSAVESALKKSGADDTTGFGLANPSIFAGGNGNQSNPYQIATEEQLRAFAAAVNVDESFSGKYIRLVSNIQLTKEWIPAGGNVPHRFKGTFDGNGKSISGMFMGSLSAPVSNRMSGLFAYLESARVKDLTLKDIAIYTNYNGAKRSYYGGLAAVIGSVNTEPCYITNVSVSGVIHVSAGYEIGYAGGIAAMMDTSIVANCAGNLDIRVQSPQKNHVYAGTLIGAFARSAAVNNLARGSIWAQSSLNHATTGGIAGLHASVSFNNIADVSMVSENPTAGVGGIMGRNTGIGLMMNSYFSGKAKQQQGSAVNAPNVGVGAIVQGSAGGFGKVCGVEAYSEEAALAAKLNANLSSQEYLNETRSLLKLWNVDIPQDIRLYRWKTAGNAVAFDTASSVSLGKTDTTGGSGSSSSGSNKSHSISASSTTAQMAAAAIEKAVGSGSKSVLAEVSTGGEKVMLSASNLIGQTVHIYRIANGTLHLHSKEMLTVSPDGTVAIGSAEAGSYVVIPTSEKPPVSNYVGTLKVAQGGLIPFKVTSGKETDAGFAAGNGSVLKTRVLNKFSGDSAQYGVYATGKLGEKSSVYVNGVKMFEVEITSAPYKSDTTSDLNKKSGETYWFKVMPGTGTSKAEYFAGNGKVLSTISKGKQKDGSLLLGFQIVGKTGTQSGVYLKIDDVHYNVFNVKVS